MREWCQEQDYCPSRAAGMSTSLYGQYQGTAAGDATSSQRLPRICNTTDSQGDILPKFAAMNTDLNVRPKRRPSVLLESIDKGAAQNAHRGSAQGNPPTKENDVSGFYPFRKGAPARLSSATSPMDEKYRESLQRHYRLLMTHIILTDDVIQQMAKEKILPETMIKDIQNGSTREERNECLLNALRLRGNRSYKRFRELMYRTGNFFVADLLWEDEDGHGMMEEKDLARFPGLLNYVQENQKKKLIHYLHAKVREKALLLAWNNCPQERVQALQSKVIDFSQEKVFRDTITSQENKIKNMECTLKKEGEDNTALKMEIGQLQQQISILKRDHRASIDTQTRFHDANLSTIIRLKDRLSTCKASVTNLNELVKLRLDIGADDSDKDEMQDDSDDEVRVNVLERNVRTILHQLKHEQEQARKAQVQREDVLKLLNRTYSREPLVAVVKDVLKHEQRHRSIVMRDILKLMDILKQISSNPASTPPAASTIPDPSILDTKHFKSQLAMLKAEAEHIQKRFTWRDSEIATLKKEIVSLKERLGDFVFHSPPTRSTSFSSTSPSPGTAILSPFQPPNTPAAHCVKMAPSDSHIPRSDSSHTTLASTSKPSALKGRLVSSAGEKRNARLDKKSARYAERLHGRESDLPSGKVVTFDDAVREKVLKQDGGVGEKGHTDLDQTLVNIEQYLQEDEKASSDSVRRGEGDSYSGKSQARQGSSSVYAPHARVNQR